MDTAKSILKNLGYIIDDDLGSGQFGSVYVCHKRNKKKRIIKVLKDERKNYNKDEIKILEHIKQSTNKCPQYVLCISSVFSDSGYTFIEFDINTKGRDLKTLYGIFLPPLYLKFIILKLVDIITFIHSVGVYHKDIKLQNIIANHIFLNDVKQGKKYNNKNNRYKIQLIDFGLSCLKSDIANVDCTLGGSPEYFTPSLAKSFLSGGVKLTTTQVSEGDVYALGYLLFLLANNRKPFSESIYETKTIKEFLIKLKSEKPINSSYHSGDTKFDTFVNDLIDKLLHRKIKTAKELSYTVHEFF